MVKIRFIVFFSISIYLGFWEVRQVLWPFFFGIISENLSFKVFMLIRSREEPPGLFWHAITKVFSCEPGWGSDSWASLGRKHLPYGCRKLRPQRGRVEEICGWQRCLPSQHEKCQEVKLLQIMDLDMEQKIWVGLFRWSRNTLSAKDLIKSAVLLIYGFQTIPESFRRKHLPFHKASPKDRSG